MARYALLINDQLSGFREHAETPQDIPHKSIRWLPCDPVSPPSFDQTSEIVEGPTYKVGSTAVVEMWTKRSLTAQEISDRKDAAISGINGGGFAPVLRALFNLNNRVRSLEGQTPLTLAQFKAAIKALM